MIPTMHLPKKSTAQSHLQKPIEKEQDFFKNFLTKEKQTAVAAKKDVYPKKTNHFIKAEAAEEEQDTQATQTDKSLENMAFVIPFIPQITHNTELQLQNGLFLQSDPQQNLQDYSLQVYLTENQTAFSIPEHTLFTKPTQANIQKFDILKTITGQETVPHHNPASFAQQKTEISNLGHTLYTQHPQAQQASYGNSLALDKELNFAVQTNQEPLQANQKISNFDSGKPEVPSLALSANFLNPEHINIKVDEAKPEAVQNFAEKTAEIVTVKLKQNISQFEIQLNPANLGKIMVKITFEQGKSVVTFTAQNEKALQLLGQNSQQIKDIIWSHTGLEPMIDISQTLPQDYLQYQQQSSSNRQQQSQFSKQEPKEEHASFAQQLQMDLTAAQEGF